MDLASNADQSPFLETCGRDTNCTSITCTILDPTTQVFVQKARLMLLPCATPTPQVEFQLIDNSTGMALFDAPIESSGDIPITITTPSLVLGVLTAFINHTSSAIGIKVRYYFLTDCC